MSILKKFFQTDEAPVEEKQAKANIPVAKVVRAETPHKSSLARKVLRRPIITEKSGLLMNQNQYVFEVASVANKIMVVAAVKDMYGIKPVNVRIIVVSEKKRQRGQIKGILSGWKKAIVTLPKGSSISVNEGGA